MILVTSSENIEEKKNKEIDRLVVRLKLSLLFMAN